MYSQRLTLIVVGSIFTLLGAIVIGLRGYVWYAHKRRQGYDDLFMALAWLCSVGFAAASFVSVRYGSGSGTSAVPVESMKKSIEAIFVVEILYGISLFCIKMSLMTLYLRIAGSVKNWFWKATVAMVVVLSLQFFAIMIAGGLQCRPIARYWDKDIPGTCININAYFYSTGIFTIISDVVILILPVSLLWSIKRPKTERLVVCAAFLFGFLSTIMSGVRLYSIDIYTLSKDPIRDAAPINTWSFIELNLGMLCASGPVLKAIVTEPRRASRSTQLSTAERSIRWQPMRTYNVTSSIDGSTYAGSSCCVETGTREQPKVDQVISSVWDGRGPVAEAHDDRVLQPYSEAAFLGPFDNIRPFDVHEWIADTTPMEDEIARHQFNPPV